MAVTIFIKKFIEILVWLDIKTTSDISITSLYLIDDWYEYVERQDIWNNRKIWTCKMWVVLKVLK